MADVNKFGQWLSVNGFLTSFTFRMLRDGKANLLHLNQYQLTDHLATAPSRAPISPPIRCSDRS